MKKIILIIILFLVFSCAREKPITTRYIDYTNRDTVSIPLIDTKIDTVVVSTDNYIWKVEIHKKIRAIDEDTV